MTTTHRSASPILALTLLALSPLTACDSQELSEEALMLESQLIPLDELDLPDPDAPTETPTPTEELELLGPDGEPTINASLQCGSVNWWYQNPWPSPWFDLANCYVTNLPVGAQGFVWANNWYVQPGPGNSCAIGTYDGANCYIGSAPTGTTAFVWAGNLYFTPTPVDAVPTNTVKTCISAGTPAQMLAECESAGNTIAGLYGDGTWDLTHYQTYWANPCPVGTSPVDQSQFYVSGSCNARPDIGQSCMGHPGSFNYELKVGVQCL